MKKSTQRTLLAAGLATLALNAMAWEAETVKLIDGMQSSIVAADFNNNGNLDLYYGGNVSTPWMLCNRNYTEQHITVMAYNNGDGTFTFDWNKPVDYIGKDDQGNDQPNTFMYVPDHNIAPSVKNHFLAADFNNDGLVDLVRICADSGWGGNYFWGGEYGREKLWDFDGNKLDEREEYRMALYYNNGDGTFTKASHDNGLCWDSVIIDWEGKTYHRPLAAGDYDNDGYIDLLVSYRKGSDGWKACTELYHNNGDGTFTKVEGTAFTDIFGSVSFGDFNNDGKLDVAVLGVTTDSRTHIYFNNGDGTFGGDNWGPIGSQKSTMLVGDFDNDGILEMFTDGWCFDGTMTGSEWGWCAGFQKYADGTISNQYINISAGDGVGHEQAMVHAGDINGDGLLDLAYTRHDWGGGVLYLTSNGDGSYTSQRLAEAQTGKDDTFSPHGYLADLTGNGVSDLVITKERDTNNTEYFNPNGTRVYINDNTATATELPQPKNVDFTEADGKLTITWEAPEGNHTDIAYNVLVEFNDGSVFSLIPADLQTGFVRIHEGKQVLLRPNQTSYTMDLSGHGASALARSSEGVVKSASVQAVHNSLSLASAFNGKDADGNPTGIEATIADNDATADAEYYNLQGIRVNNPIKGQIYIVREGAKVSKLAF